MAKQNGNYQYNLWPKSGKIGHFGLFWPYVDQYFQIFQAELTKKRVLGYYLDIFYLFLGKIKKISTVDGQKSKNWLFWPIFGN